MAKVKIVQIAVAMNDQDTSLSYLDDKGRVWYDGGHLENCPIDENNTDGTKMRWVTEWKQVDLPDEPTE
jgi:hypothetical protein